MVGRTDSQTILEKWVTKTERERDREREREKEKERERERERERKIAGLSVPFQGVLRSLTN